MKKREYEYEYNSELKYAYIGEIKDFKEDALNVIMSRLKSIDNYEVAINKSILDWTSKDTEDFLRFVSAKSKISLDNLFHTVRDYATFCEIQRVKKTHSNVLSNFFADENLFTHKSLGKFVNTQKVEESIMGHSEYINIIRDNNVYTFTKICAILMWHGVKFNTSSEIFNYKRADIFDENYQRILSRNGEWENLDEAERHVLLQFEEDQTAALEEYKGVFYPRVDTGEESFYVCEQYSELLFHPVIAYGKPKINKSGARFTSATYGDGLSYSSGPGRRAWNELIMYIDRTTMRPKDLVKSGCYYRMIRDFEFTEDILKEKSSRMAWRDYAAPYCRFEMSELHLAYKANNT